MSDAKTEAMAKLNEIGAKLDALTAAVAALKQTPRSAPTGGGLVFPPYGRAKGTPIAGATQDDLSFYKRGCERTLGDPEKARFHDRERILLAAINKELGIDDGPPPADDAPPAADEIPF